MCIIKGNRSVSERVLKSRKQNESMNRLMYVNGDVGKRTGDIKVRSRLDGEKEKRGHDEERTAERSQ